MIGEVPAVFNGATRFALQLAQQVAEVGAQIAMADCGLQRFVRYATVICSVVFSGVLYKSPSLLL
jgi:hypothetical protein